MAATYATLANLRGVTGVLSDLTSVDTNRDTMLQACLDDAQAILDAELGTTLTAAATGTQVVYGNGTQYLTPPVYTANSVTLVEAPGGYTVPTYADINGSLVITDSNGILAMPTYPLYSLPANFWFDTYTAVWSPNVPYTVHATFGTSASDMNVLRRMTLELAVHLWKYRDAGGTSVIGTEVAIVNVKESLSPWARGALTRLQRKYGGGVGVW